MNVIVCILVMLATLFTLFAFMIGPVVGLIWVCIFVVIGIVVKDGHTGNK